MKVEQIVGDVSASLRARMTLLWVVTREEVRAERGLIQAAGAAKYVPLFWDCALGLTDATGATVDGGMQNPVAMMKRIMGESGGGGARAVYVLRDLHKWTDPVVLRWVRTVARELQTTQPARALIVLSPSAEVPPELAGHAVVIDWPLPDREEIGRILDDAIGSLPEEIAASAAPNGVREAAIDGAVGLSAEEAANCYARSIVTSRKVDPKLVAAEKRRVIARERVLTWYDPDPRGLEAIGGLDLLKRWLAQRRAAFGEKARAYGLPAPKGVLLLGPPGCGKSLTAKAVATAWGMPLLRLDMGALKSKYVGESEGNIRKALAVAQTVAPCVLWLDEIEKAMAGSTGSQGDGGVSADALGAVLSWMQERTESVFVVATANDVSALPPELLRKGRFDELFFVDLPTVSERAAILRAACAAHGRAFEPMAAELDRLMTATEGWSGAELAAIVPDALFGAFADGEREMHVGDLEAATFGVVPLSRTARERIEDLRKWSQGRTRPASSPEIQERGRRVLDV